MFKQIRKGRRLVLFVDQSGVILTINKTPFAGGSGVVGSTVFERIDNEHQARLTRSLRKAFAGSTQELCCCWEADPIGPKGWHCWHLVICPVDFCGLRFCVIAAELLGPAPQCEVFQESAATPEHPDWR